MENILRCKLQNVNHQNAVKSTEPAMHMASNVECKLHIASHQNAIKCHMQQLPWDIFWTHRALDREDKRRLPLNKEIRQTSCKNLSSWIVRVIAKVVPLYILLCT